MSRLVDLADVAPGFDNPALQSQRVFRAIMQAQARPGTIADLADVTAPAPGALHRAAAAVALTLCDRDTPVWFSPAFTDIAIANWLRFHCGSPLVETPAKSAFAFADRETAPALSALNIGEPRYPDRSTTLVLMCDALDGGAPLQMTGPGILDTKTIAPLGLPDSVLQERAALHDQFPLGIDVLLVADARVMAWPRTTRITAQGGN